MRQFFLALKVARAGETIPERKNRALHCRAWADTLRKSIKTCPAERQSCDASRVPARRWTGAIHAAWIKLREIRLRGARFHLTQGHPRRPLVLRRVIEELGGDLRTEPALAARAVDRNIREDIRRRPRRRQLLVGSWGIGRNGAARPAVGEVAAFIRRW